MAQLREEMARLTEHLGRNSPGGPGDPPNRRVTQRAVEDSGTTARADERLESNKQPPPLEGVEPQCCSAVETDHLLHAQSNALRDFRPRQPARPARDFRPSVDEAEGPLRSHENGSRERRGGRARRTVVGALVAHAQLLSVLNGNSKAVTTTNGQVVLNLVPLFDAALQNLQGFISGVVGKPVQIPTISGNEIPASACQKIGTALNRPSPTPAGRFRCSRRTSSPRPATWCGSSTGSWCSCSSSPRWWPRWRCGCPGVGAGRCCNSASVAFWVWS